MNRVFDQRCRELVGRWLDSLTSDRWQETPTDLAIELAAMANYGDPVYANPSGKLKPVEPLICARGWSLSFGRPGKARRVAFERLKS